MIRSIVRAATLGMAALGGMCVAQAASATVFTFTDKGTTSTAGVSSYTFGSNDGTLSVKATAWHANDPNSSAVTTDTISSASLGFWQNAGLGVLYGDDSTSGGTHQIDNYSKAGTAAGVDFVMLQFSQDVTLNSIYRNVYKIDNTSCCDSDAAYWADTGNALGAPSTTANIDLSKYSFSEGMFTGLNGGSGAGNTALNTSKSASVWLVSAGFNQNNDGFKIANLAVSAGGAGAVPEPASWAMMIVGFGMVGTAMRRRKTATLANA